MKNAVLRKKKIYSYAYNVPLYDVKWILSKRVWSYVVSMGESARLVPSSSFYVVTSAILGSKSFKIGGNFWIILLKSYKSKDLTSFLD